MLLLAPLPARNPVPKIDGAIRLISFAGFNEKGPPKRA